MSDAPQLPLALGYPAEQRFERFLPSTAAAPVMLREAVDTGQRVFVCGPAGSGKSHLLLACAAYADAAGKRVAYLPLAALGNNASGLIGAQAVMDLVCVDDIDLAAGEPSVEHALFSLHNRQGDARCALVYSARSQPDELPLLLPDLHSRLAHCLRVTLSPLDEAQRRELLVARAQARGLALEDAALDYLFRRVGRDLGTLTELFERLDRASLAAQRRLTVPFLRDVLERGAG